MFSGDSGIQQTRCWRVRSGLDQPFCELFNELTLIRRREVGKELGGFNRASKFCDVVEEVERRSKLRARRRQERYDSILEDEPLRTKRRSG